MMFAMNGQYMVTSAAEVTGKNFQCIIINAAAVLATLTGEDSAGVAHDLLAEGNLGTFTLAAGMIFGYHKITGVKVTSGSVIGYNR